ncbi:MAG TPA: GAF domain-containing protein [Saprospiraceae bacterium]|nr:GAF domain-containing protein [Saprospiraceae bacterium]
MAESKLLRVLLADDNPEVRNSVERRLSKRGVNVQTFSNARELLAHLHTLSPDDMPTAVITDYVLPDMSGDQLVREILTSYRQLPLIVVSGEDMRGSIRSYGLGAYAVMQKPLDYNELIVILRELSETDQVAMEIAGSLKDITEFGTCLVWELDRKDYPNYRITGWSGCDREFASTTIMWENKYPRITKLKKGKALFIEDVHKVDYFIDKKAAEARGWVSLISLPMMRQGKLIGWIDCYKNEQHDFKNEQRKKHQLVYLLNYTKLAAQALYARQLKQYSRVVHETQQNLAGALQESLIYNTILEKALATTGADYGWIYRYNPEGKYIELGAAAGPGADKVEKKRYLTKGGITGKVADKGISLYVRDVDQPEDAYSPDVQVNIKGLTEKSVLAVPLRRGKRTLGVLTVSSRHIDFFLPEEMQLLTSLAAIAAVSMERDKLAYHLQGISKLAAETSDFERLAQYVVDAVHDLTDADVNLWLMSAEENEGDHYLRLRQTSIHERRGEDIKIPTAPGSSIDAVALQKKRFQIVDNIRDYSGEPGFVDKEALLGYNWNSFMTVPLLGKQGEALGVISTMSREVNRFTEEEGNLVQHFANQAALALQEQRHIRILQELANTGEQLTVGRSDAKALLDKVVQFARQVTHADLTVLYPYDPVKKLYYDDESIVFSGTLKDGQKIPSQKPRENGMAAFVRRYEAMIVEYIPDMGELEIQTGLRKPTALKPDSDAHQEATKFIRESKFVKRENVQAFIGVSLRAEEHQRKGSKIHSHEVAVLYFNFRAPRHFSKEELQVIDIFCHQVANVIHRNRLFYSLRKEREVLEGVYQSALRIMQEKNQRTLLGEIVAEAVRLLHGKGGVVYLLSNGSRQDLTLVASKGLKKKYMKIGDKLPEGKGLAREVIDTKEYRIVDNYSEFHNKIDALADFYTAVVEVPLLFNNDVIGVLGVFDDHDKRVFTEDDAAVLEKLAAQAALALYNGRLYEELDALNQTGLEIAKQAPLQEIANRILEQLKRVIDYDKATIQLIEGKDTPRKELAHAGYDQPGNRDKFCRPVNQDPLILEIVESKKIRILSDTNQEELWDIDDPDVRDVRSWACMPLIYGDQITGLLMLDHKTPGYYLEKDIPKLERFALQAAIGIQNASEEHRYLRSLNEFSTQINDYDDKTLLIRAALHRLIEVLKAQRAFCYLNESEYLQLEGAKSDEKVSFAPYTYDDKENQALFTWEQRGGNRAEVVQTDDGAQHLIGPLWAEGKLIGALDVVGDKESFDSNAVSFFFAMTTLARQGLYGIHTQERKTTAFKRRTIPYIVGPPIFSHSNFYGRENIVRLILDSLHQNNFLIEDERRIGKTSLLYHLKYQLEQRNDSDYVFFPVYLNIQATKEDEFWGHLRDSLFSIQGKARPFETGKYDYFDFRSDMVMVLNELENQTAGREIRVVLLMDEVDQLKNYNEITLSKLRRLFQEEARLGIVMAGYEVKRHLNHITSPWYNQLVLLKLNAMKEENARQLIMEPVRGVYSYASDAVDFILKESMCKPYQIQKICHDAVAAMLNREHQLKEKGQKADAMITLEDVMEAIINKTDDHTDEKPV